MNLPNSITLFRFVLIPCFALLWWRGEHVAALMVFGLASLTDWLDGFFARLLDQRTRLGQFLDPAADKLMVLTCFVTAAAMHAVPIWLAVLVVGRDVGLSLGGALFAFVLRGRLEPSQWKPSRIGKYTTFTQVLVIGLSLIAQISGASPLEPYVDALVIACAVLTVTSAVQYLAFGLRGLAGGKLARGGTA